MHAYTTQTSLIRRELSKIYTIGTLTEEFLIRDNHSSYLLAVKEKPNVGKISATLQVTYGICLLDAATGEFNMGEFTDDKQRTQFETLVLQTRPKEILYEKSGLTWQTTAIIKKNLVNPVMNSLVPDKEFWDAEKTMQEVRVAEYFGEEGIVS